MGAQVRTAYQSARPSRVAAQGGFALAWVLAALVVGTLGVLALALAWQDARNDSYSARARDRALDLAYSRLDDWYRTRSAEAEPFVLTNAPSVARMRQALRLEGIEPRVQLLRAPVRSSAHGVAFSRFLLWIPPTGRADDTAWDASLGTWRVGSDVAAREYSGQGVQIARFGQSTQRLQELARALEQWFSWRVALDPAHDAGRNYFHAANCASPAANELACYAANSPVSTTDLGSRIGVSGSGFTDAWGRDIEIDNTVPTLGADLPPFSVRVRFVPPGTADQDGSGRNLGLTGPVVVTAQQRVS